MPSTFEATDEEKVRFPNAEDPNTELLGGSDRHVFAAGARLGSWRLPAGVGKLARLVLDVEPRLKRKNDMMLANMSLDLTGLSCRPANC